MKKLFVCFLAFLLCACVNTSDIRTEVDELVNSMAQENITLVPNHKKKYYSYYVPSNISNLESTDSHNIFQYNGINIMMNLNVADIITYEIYGIEKEDSEVFENDMIIYNRKNLSCSDKTYDLSIYHFDDNYVIRIDTHDVVMASSMKENYVVNTLRQMIIIAASVNVDTEMVIDGFSNKDFIDFEKEQTDLFKIIVPKDGRIEELIDPKGSIETGNEEVTEPDSTDVTEEE